MSDYAKSYNPNRSADWNYGGKNWKLSRSKVDLFLECPRCFYLDNKLGTKRPSFPSFNLNLAVDELLKREFDEYRKQQKPHPIMEKHDIQAIPFVHSDLDIWRDNFAGLEHKHPATELLVSGALDDVWINNEKELIVVDYKATSKKGSIVALGDSPWEKQYQRQISFYQWLLRQMGHKVSKTGYFVYTNAKQDGEEFDNRLLFETTLLECQGDDSWIEKALTAIKTCLTAKMYPESGGKCEYCQYREASGKKLMKIYKENNGK